MQEAHNYRKQDQLFHMVMHLPCALAAVSEAVQVPFLWYLGPIITLRIKQLRCLEGDVHRLPQHAKCLSCRQPVLQTEPISYLDIHAYSCTLTQRAC